MPAKTHARVLVTCPHCRHQQPEPSTAISSVCKKCGGHLRVQELLRPVAETRTASEPNKNLRRISCFECKAELEVAPSAESTMCKRCSGYIDLKDYHINSAVSKNFKTKGSFVIEQKGYVFNTVAVVGDAILKGRFLGKLIADSSLTIYSTAEIKGSFSARRLIIPAANHFQWKEPLQIGDAEIAGELVANLHVEHTLILKSTARFFGDAEARNMIVEDGAVVVGRICVSSAKAEGTPGT